MQELKIVFVNQASASIIGYSVKEIQAWDTYEYSKCIHPDDREFSLDQSRKKLEGSSESVPNYSLRIIHRNGNIKWINQHSQMVMLGGKPAILSTLVDITDLKHVEGALRKSEAKSRAILEAIPDLMLIIKEDGKIMDFKESTDSALSLPSRMVKGKVIRKLLPVDFTDENSQKNS